ncbi:MAG: DNA repair protein RadC [Clostridia bacterium]|nr:DNA repair protein RadC [Clostridia bacterium]
MTMHDGHRKRMRERFRLNGLEGFAPHEVLELLLFYGRARGDVNTIAHALLDTFGTLQGVLEATPAQLMSVPGVGEETATLISLMIPMFRRYSVCAAEAKKNLRCRQDAMDYAMALMAGWRVERLYVVCLDADCRVIGQRMISEGTHNEVQAYPRLVVETALNYNAHSVLLCHNHPGGSTTPSAADIDTTRLLQRLLHHMGVALQDHIIVSGGECRSMVLEGDLEQSSMRARAIHAKEGKV